VVVEQLARAVIVQFSGSRGCGISACIKGDVTHCKHN